MWILRALMLLALIVWVGGIIFFAFVMAPTLFTVLPSTRLAGEVVSPALRSLHWMGLVSGELFLLCSVLYNRQRYAQLRVFTATHVFIMLMLALTAVSQFVITPRIQANRVSWTIVSQAGYQPYIPGTLVQLKQRYSEEFESLHKWSTRLESAVLLCGLGVVILTARRWESQGS